MIPNLHGNLVELQANIYPGRGLIVGTDESGQYAIQVYWIMGRSSNSQNRVFSKKGGKLFTEAADPAKVEDPSLIIYNAMDEFGDVFIVSNGDQTDTVITRCKIGGLNGFKKALSGCQYEPDAPNFTPRITAECRISGGTYSAELGLLKKTELMAGKQCLRFFYEYQEILPGVGFCLTTYAGDGNPLPSFVGEPIALPLIGSAEEILDTYWEVLYHEYRVSLAVKRINLRTGESEILIRNQYKKIGE